MLLLLLLLHRRGGERKNAQEVSDSAVFAQPFEPVTKRWLISAPHTQYDGQLLILFYIHCNFYFVFIQRVTKVEFSKPEIHHKLNLATGEESHSESNEVYRGECFDRGYAVVVRQKEGNVGKRNACWVLCLTPETCVVI